MARFFARFDNAGSPNPGTSFDTRTIAASSASGALYKIGLLASRSAVSADFLSELEPANRIGGNGIYFPADLFINTAGVLTASAYTSSLPGIVTPVDYATRPTASITSSTSHVVGPTNPLDSGSVTYDVYLSASNAVSATLNAIQPATPYARLGLNESRTLHSVYHNPGLDYFAWDDFTPGTASAITVELSRPNTYTDDITGNTFVAFVEIGAEDIQFSYSWATQYLADRLGTTGLTGSLRTNGVDRRVLTKSVSDVVATTLDFRPGGTVYDGDSSDTQYQVFTTMSLTFADVTIPTHTNYTSSLLTVIDGATQVRIQAVYSRSVKIDATDPCVGTDHWVFSNTNNGADGSDSTPPDRIYADKLGNAFNDGGARYVAFRPYSATTRAYQYGTDGKVTATFIEDLGCSSTGTCVLVTGDINQASSGTDCTGGTSAGTLYSSTATPTGGSYIYTNDTCTTVYSATSFVRVLYTNTVHEVDAGRLATTTAYQCAEQ
jgi:hypothetical protein